MKEPSLTFQATACKLAAMQFFMPSGQQPMTWWRGKPIFLTTLIVLIHIPAMILTAIMLGKGWPTTTDRVVFFLPPVIEGEWWRLLTFPFVIPPSFWLLLGLFFFWQFGREVEGALGWRKFLALYLLLCWTPALAASVCSFFGSPLQEFGTNDANFAVFIAFAVLQPEANMFLLNVKAKWVAVAFIALGVLMQISSPIRGVAGAFVFLSSVGVCYLFLRLQGVRGGFGWLNRWNEQRREIRQERAERRKVLESKDHFISEQVDPILDKIAKEGMQSLTEDEKKILARAKDKLR
jgi:rhomboid family protein